MVAPSGYGKTVAAAQFAKSCDSAIWIGSGPSMDSKADLFGRLVAALDDVVGEPNIRGDRNRASDVDLLDCIESQLRLLDRNSRCIVIDDATETSLESVLAGVLDIAQLGVPNLCTVVTTRSARFATTDTLRRCTLLGPRELALSQQEATNLYARQADGAESNCESVSEMREACGGHVALFAVIASHSPWSGEWAACTDSSSDPLLIWLRHLVDVGLVDAERTTLHAMSLLGSGRQEDLVRLGVASSRDELSRIASMLPLVSIRRHGRGHGLEFRVHDLIDDFRKSATSLGWDRDPVNRCRGAIALLSERADYGRAMSLLAELADDDATVDWLGAHGSTLVESGESRKLGLLLDTIPISVLFSHPRLLLISSILAANRGEYEDALGRVRAAVSLAEHSGDRQTRMEALARCVVYHCDIGQFDVASTLAKELLDGQLESSSGDGVVRCLTAYSMAAMGSGDYDAAQRGLTEALRLNGQAEWAALPEGRMRMLLGIIPALARGDFTGSSQVCAQHLNDKGMWLTEQVTARGNLAAFLSEVGRLERAQALLVDAISTCESSGLRLLQGSFLPVLGCVSAGLGDCADAISLMRRGIAMSLETGDEPSAQVDRVHLSVVLRAHAEAVESLSEAERAFEHLSVNDMFCFRRLAALEVAASLLALGDCAAARAWTETVVAEGFGENLYHALRADMILAEIDRREDALGLAIERITAASEHILTGSSNWQIAMYCRAFPELLGVFSMALGTEALPAHMLRMILPEHAEASLVRCKPFMPNDEWQALGERLIGKDETEKLVARHGLPLCHVRLFGGLEVIVGGRVVRERDWKKRKARLLFAMLVTQRGRDIPRDQLVEYLWPEMDEERAKNNLYVAWSTMKSVLSDGNERGVPCPYVESVGGLCRTVSVNVRSDVDDFSAALVSAKEHEAAGRIREAVSAYEHIADLYRGDLLPGDVYDDWFAGLREQYRIEFVDAMLRCAAILFEADDPGNALVFVRRAIQCDPCREDLYQHALKCQIAAGQRSSAIETYFQLRSRLSEDLGLDPSAETKALYEQILAMEGTPRPIPLDPLGEACPASEA